METDNYPYQPPTLELMSASGKPSLVVSQTAPDRIVISAEFPQTVANALFDFWTNPELLTKWWPPVAELRAEARGSYHFSWPNQNWHLRGTFIEFERGKKLGFTWRWDHEPTDLTQVRVIFEPMSKGGTMLTLHHGNYAPNAEGKKLRDEHIEGWIYFLGRLEEQPK